MAPLLPPSDDGKYRYSHTTQHPLDGETIRADRVRPGNLTSKQFRVVCRACNHGWMNALEQAARPLLEPLIRGESCYLPPEKVHVVAKWIAMKAMVSEQSDRARVTTPYEARNALKELGRIPNEFRVYLASHSAKERVGFRRDSATVALTGERPSFYLGNQLPNIEQVTWTMGSVVAQVTAAFETKLTIEDTVANFTHKVAQIWPLPSTGMKWPTQVVLSDQGVERFGTGLRDIISSLQHWGGERGELLPW